MTAVRTSGRLPGGRRARRPATDWRGPANNAPLAPRLQPHFAARDLRKLIPGSVRSHEDRVNGILGWLQVYRIPALPVHTGPRVTPRADGAGFDLRGNPRQIGLADIIAALPPFGRLVMIEVKTGRARKRSEQVECHRRLAAAGAISLTAHTVDDLGVLLEWMSADQAVQRLSNDRRFR